MTRRSREFLVDCAIVLILGAVLMLGFLIGSW